LPLPATAVLLIALSLPNEFLLPQRHGAQWYGLSRDTVRRGLATLEAMGLLTYRVRKKKAPLAPAGVTNERFYKLIGPLEKQ
jgi:DNA-binding transcriptional MocR family regulator